jgi:DNA-directed RNA polymerase subunit RPC12/RpoP
MDDTNEPVTTARRSRACPRCGSREIARVRYGMPPLGDQPEADLAARRVVLGGCMVWDDQPDRSCRTCGLEFRADGRTPVADPWS